MRTVISVPSIDQIHYQDESVKCELQAIIHKSQSLRTVDLRELDLDIDSTVSLLTTLSDNSRVKQLYKLPMIAKDHYKEDRVINALADLIAKSQSLKTLDLRDFEISEEKVVQLLTALYQSASVKSIVMLPMI